MNRIHSTLINFGRPGPVTDLLGRWSLAANESSHVQRALPGGDQVCQGLVGLTRATILSMSSWA